MNKIFRILSLPFFLSVIGLNSCSSESEKIQLVFGNKNLETVQTLSFLELKEKIDSKESFLLAVQYSDGCACWNQEARPVIEKYIKEKHVIIYHVKRDELVGGGDSFGIKIVTGQVSFAIFKDGELADSITSEDATLKNYDKFKSYVESLVNLPKLFYVSLDDVDNMYKSNEKNIIYFSRNTCGDCNYIDSHFLVDWSKNHPTYSKEIYVLDCDQKGIRYNEDGEYDETNWFAFKDKYGLSKLNNENYGYDTGYVPSFYLISGNNSITTFHSGAVYFNDTISLENDEYVVSNSYYTSERATKLQYLDNVDTKILKGLKLNKDDVTVYPEYGNYISWNHESAEKYHSPLLEKFLEYAEKQ